MAAASSTHHPNHNPHFFRVVLAHDLKEHKLEIPKMFVRQHGVKAFLENQICLKVADGKEWNIGLIKSDGRVWFYHGWQKLVEFYSIEFGYFLVFKYEYQSSNFHVVIFDLTATEIGYPTEVKIEKMETIDLDDHDDQKTRLDESEEKAKTETFDFYAQDFKVGEIGFGTKKPTNGGRKRPPSTASQQARAMAEAIGFQSTTSNPSFIRKIWHSHIHPGTLLNIPKSFADIHLDEQTEFMVKNSEGRIWGIRCGFYFTSKMQRKVELRNGWKTFSRDNDLQPGDACVFEMLRKNTKIIFFHVVIFRAS